MYLWHFNGNNPGCKYVIGSMAIPISSTNTNEAILLLTCLPILGVKLECLLHMKIIVSSMKWPTLLAQRAGKVCVNEERQFGSIGSRGRIYLTNRR